jgi:hypothetical protein
MLIVYFGCYSFRVFATVYCCVDKESSYIQTEKREVLLKVRITFLPVRAYGNLSAPHSFEHCENSLCPYVFTLI